MSKSAMNVIRKSPLPLGEGWGEGQIPTPINPQGEGIYRPEFIAGCMFTYPCELSKDEGDSLRFTQLSATPNSFRRLACRNRVATNVSGLRADVKFSLSTPNTEVSSSARAAGCPSASP